MSSLYVITVTYTKPIQEIDSLLGAHRDFLKKGYEKGFLLASGPQNPRTGGVIIGRFADKTSAEAFTHEDPFYGNHAATYAITEFEPVLYNNSFSF